MEKELIVYLWGGIGDRLKGIVTTSHLANKYRFRRKLMWTRGPDLNCGFYSIFARIDNSQVFQDTKDFWKLESSKIKLNEQTKFEILCKFHRLVCSTNRILDGASVDLLREINWSHYIDSQVRKFIGLYPLNDVLGVHVRRGDLNIGSNRVIPVNSYFDFIDDKFPKSLLMLSTESKAVEHKFHEKYPGRILQYEVREMSRISDVGVQDAVIQMLLLSKCVGIVSGWSGFSQMASLIGRVPWYTLYNSERREVDDY